MTARRIGTISTGLLLACVHGGTRGTPPVRDAADGRVAVPGSVGARDAVVAIARIVASDSLVGRRVRVAGRCLGYGGATAAFGGPPRTRSDWQLADSTGAVYVVGARPNDCPREAGTTRRVTVLGVVAQDTVRGLRGEIARRFVVADSAW